MRNAEQTIGHLIDKASGAQICYIDADGYPVTRAMLKPRVRNGIAELFFTTNTSSDKVAAFRACPMASVYFIDKRFFRGISLCGHVEVIESAEAKQWIWRDGDERYYPLGVTDPDYCVLKFTAQSGRYYSNFRSENFTV